MSKIRCKTCGFISHDEDGVFHLSHDCKSNEIEALRARIEVQDLDILDLKLQLKCERSVSHNLSMKLDISRHALKSVDQIDCPNCRHNYIKTQRALQKLNEVKDE